MSSRSWAAGHSHPGHSGVEAGRIYGLLYRVDLDVIRCLSGGSVITELRTEVEVDDFHSLRGDISAEVSTLSQAAFANSRIVD